MTMTWAPISGEDLGRLIAGEISGSPAPLAELFNRHRVPLRTASIARSNRSESVFVVAQSGAWAIYYDDIEEGFNISELNADGSIKTPGGDQWDLATALQELDRVAD